MFLQHTVKVYVQLLMSKKVSLVVLIVGMTLTSTAGANCWVEAGERYGVNPKLLWAIASAESDLKPQAHNLSHIKRTGTRDIGLMQINSGALPKLKEYGIQEKDLWHPCTNIGVGAWILVDKMAKLGPTWNAVGAYNAACTTLSKKECIETRSRYAWRVYSRYVRAVQHTGRRIRPEEIAPAALGPTRGVATIQTVSFSYTARQRETDEK